MTTSHFSSASQFLSAPVRLYARECRGRFRGLPKSRCRQHKDNDWRSSCALHQRLHGFTFVHCSLRNLQPVTRPANQPGKTHEGDPVVKENPAHSWVERASPTNHGCRMLCSEKPD